MGLDEQLRIDRIHGADTPARPATTAADGHPAAFRELLERIAASGAGSEPKDPATAPPADVDALDSALARADADYAEVMRLRELLEDAWRRREPS